MSNYYIVRTYTDVDKYVHAGVSAIGWSKYDLAHENIDFVIAKLEEEWKTNNISSRQRGKWSKQLKRFRSIKQGDIILVPCYKGFYIGIATGEFRFDKGSVDKDLANQVVLDFIKGDKGPIAFKRDSKMTALSKKLGVPGFTVLSIWESKIIAQIDTLIAAGKDIAYDDQVYEIEKQRLEEFRKALPGALSNPVDSSLKSKGRGFEELISEILKRDNFSTYILPKKVGGNSVADADVLAVKKSVLGEEFDTAYCIQAKHYQGSSDNGINQILEFKKQNIEKSENGIICINRLCLKLSQIKYMLVSSGSFTPAVEEQALENDIILIDGERLADLVFHVIDDMPELRRKLGFVKSYQRFDI